MQSVFSMDVHNDNKMANTLITVNSEIFARGFFKFPTGEVFARVLFS